MNIGSRHFHVRQNKKITTAMDRVVYLFSAFGVVVIIPQLLQIWIHKNVEGVSLATWMGFTFGTVFWLVYGIIHREKPIIVANLAAFIANSLIIIGLLFNQ